MAKSFVITKEETEDGRSYEERLNEPYTRFEKAVEKYDEKPDSELLDLSNEITSETASVYTEIGMQIALLLMRDILKNIGVEKNGISDISEENPTVSHANETLLEGMYKERVERALQEVLRKDKKYQKADEETKQKIKEIDQIEMDKREWEIIDRALPATSAATVEYGRVAYRQGFLDAASLLRK